jgi:DNA-binding IclR family transcriptional regulator
MKSETHEFLARQPAAVDSAFAVLEAVARMGPGVTARELTEALPMSRATVYRIVKHLVANEYLVRTPDLRGFVIGERVRALSGAAATEPVFTKPP